MQDHLYINVLKSRLRDGAHVLQNASATFPENRGQRKFAAHMPWSKGKGHMRCKISITKLPWKSDSSDTEVGEHRQSCTLRFSKCVQRGKA